MCRPSASGLIRSFTSCKAGLAFDGDRLMLRQLAAQGLADRLLVVLNVEAFEPLGEGAFRNCAPR